jgi:hypothetical protein
MAKRRKTKMKAKPQPSGELIRLSMTQATSPRAQVRDKVSNPSHSQMSLLLGAMVSPTYMTTAHKTMTKIVKRHSEQEVTDLRSTLSKVVGKTPVTWLEEVLSSISGSVSINIQDTPYNPLADLTTGYFFECVLNRASNKKKHRVNNESRLSETIPLVKFQDDEGTDNQWSTVVLVLPHSSVFYVASQMNNEVLLKRVGFVALPLSWLRIQRKLGQPAKGAYIRSIKRVFSIRYIARPSIQTIPCYQMDDKEEGTPLMPPDIFNSVSVPVQSEARKKYRSMMGTSLTNGSFRYGCRCYIKAAHHSRIPPTSLIFDRRVEGNAVFAVTVRDSAGRVHDVSYIQVNSVGDYPDLLNLLQQGSSCIQGKPGNCRQHNGDGGKMFGLGEMKIAGVAGLTETKATRYITQDNLLAKINAKSAEYARSVFHSILPTMKHIETQAGRSPSTVMGGDFSPSCSMDISCNLANSSHYDVGDGSVGYSIWIEKKPGDASNWYFVLPNILVEYKQKTYNGIAIKLHHGISIAWDGRVIRHGTSVTEVINKQTTASKKDQNRCYGWFWAADMKSAKVEME